MSYCTLVGGGSPSYFQMTYRKFLKSCFNGFMVSCLLQLRVGLCIILRRVSAIYDAEILYNLSSRHLEKKNTCLFRSHGLLSLYSRQAFCFDYPFDYVGKYKLDEQPSVLHNETIGEEVARW